MTNLLLLILVLALAAAFARYLTKTILGDGYGTSLQHRQPPRSHPQNSRTA